MGPFSRKTTKSYSTKAPAICSVQRSAFECVSGRQHFVQVSSSDEGGVAAGFAVLDSPYLID